MSTSSDGTSRKRRVADDPLALFRTKPGCYRFQTRRLFWAGLFVAIAMLVGGLVAIAWTETSIALRVVGIAIMLASLLPAARFIPRWRWFEIEDGAAFWKIRQRFGWSTSTREVVKTRIAMASVEDESRAETFFPRDQHVAIYLGNDQPFGRGDTPPIILGDSFGLPVDVLVEICKLLAPGYTRETYLLKRS